MQLLVLYLSTANWQNCNAMKHFTLSKGRDVCPSDEPKLCYNTININGVLVRMCVELQQSSISRPS